MNLHPAPPKQPPEGEGATNDDEDLGATTPRSSTSFFQGPGLPDLMITSCFRQENELTTRTAKADLHRACHGGGGSRGSRGVLGFSFYIVLLPGAGVTFDNQRVTNQWCKRNSQPAPPKQAPLGSAEVVEVVVVGGSTTPGTGDAMATVATAMRAKNFMMGYRIWLRRCKDDIN